MAMVTVSNLTRYRNWQWPLFLVFLLSLSGAGLAQQDTSPLVAALNTKAFAAKFEAAQALAASGDPRAELILEAMLQGRLYALKKDRTVVIAKPGEGGYAISNAATGTELGVVSKRKLRKVGVNNRLRSKLRGLIAGIQLSDPDPALRLAAVNSMKDSIDDKTVALLQPLLAVEADPEVRQAIETVLQLQALDSQDADTRLQAMAALDGSVDQVLRNKLQKMSADESLDAATIRAARRQLIAMDSKIDFYGQLETLYFGISLGSILVLAAIGLAITFGVMGVINMAHGELIMLGAYTTFVIQELMPNAIGWSLMVAIPSAFLVSAMVGVIIERGIIRHLYGRPLETLLATFGVSLILQQAVRSIFSPLNRSVITPEWMSGSLYINDFLSLTYNRLYVILFCLLVFAALQLILKRTRLGLEVRAVTQNRNMARAMGIRSDRVDALTFGLGSGIAGIAGVALSQLTNVGPNLGQAYIVDSFMVVVFGGVGNLWGTLIGGLSLGIGNKLIEPYAGTVMAKILVLVFIILFIQKRPRGLFPQKGRAAEN
jgi:urea transport system permease protein